MILGLEAGILDAVATGNSLCCVYRKSAYAIELDVNTNFLGGDNSNVIIPACGYER